MSICKGCMTEKGNNIICPNCGLNENEVYQRDSAAENTSYINNVQNTMHNNNVYSNNSYTQNVHNISPNGNNSGNNGNNYGNNPYGNPYNTQYNNAPYNPYPQNNYNPNSHRTRNTIITVALLATILVCTVIVLSVILSNNHKSSNSFDNPSGAGSGASSAVAPPKKTITVIDHTYEVVVKKCTWETAYQEAANAGGHLVTINDQEEFDKIKSILSSYPNIRNIWIGAAAPEGYYSSTSAINYWNSSDAKWITGEPFNFASWRAGEPSGTDINTGANERYLQIFKPKADGFWSFNDTSNDLRYNKDGSMGYMIEYETERTIEE